jgi:hypothetical protein
MSFQKEFMTKYFEVLKTIDYDTELNNQLESVDNSIGEYNIILDNILIRMDRFELIALLKQSVKHDMSSGSYMGENDTLWNELDKFRDELITECENNV